MSPSPIPDWPGWPSDPDSERISALSDRLIDLDGPADEAGTWPDDLWQTLVDSAATVWAIPPEFGGIGLDRVSIIRRYARVAEGSLTAAFILTQHDAAVRRLAGSDRRSEKTVGWLEAIAEKKAFATVGISQLTTSRRRGPEALIATEHEDGFRLTGAMPWVTAAEKADVLVTGALTPDGRQLLIAVPTDRPGIEILPSFSLAALQASRTTEVTCENVQVLADEILVGPAIDVMASPSLAGTGGLETSALALGQSRAALRALVALGERDSQRGDLWEPTDALAAEWLDVASSLIAAAGSRPDAPAPAVIRHKANRLALRSTQAFLTARKGSGFLRNDSAQRFARQSLFFLVWSCPAPVAQATLRDLAGLCEV